MAQHENPTFVLGRVRTGRREDRLADVGGLIAEGVHDLGAGFEVVADHVRRQDRMRPRKQPGDVAVPRRKSDPPIVDAGKVPNPIVELGLGDGPSRPVDGPLPERRLIAEVVHPAFHDRIGSADLDNDLIAPLVRVQCVKHRARLDLVPGDIGVRPVARHHAHARTRSAVEAESPVLEREHDRQVIENREMFRDREVVHHHRPRDVDHLGLHEVPVRVEPVVGEVRLGHELVAEEQQLAGHRTQLRVRGHRRGEPTAEVHTPDGRQRSVDLPRHVSFLEREQPTGVADDVRIRR